MNWPKQLLYWVAIIAISFFTYEKLIKVKTNILPDFTTLANELWIIILIFIFQVTNNIRFSSDGTIKRKVNYIKSRYTFFKAQFGEVIREITKNEALEIVVYSILIYENFNRPKIIRYIENLKHWITNKPHTLGVMQVKTDTIISDLESVKLGAEKIVNAYQSYLNELKNNNYEFYEYNAYFEIISKYNGGENYKNEIIEVLDVLKANFYDNTIDTLEPTQKSSTSQPC